MYSWGGDTTNWKKPGGYKYDSARKPYLDKLASASAAKGGRTFASRSSPDMDLVDSRGKKISSDSENPIIVGVDVTGSMSSWPEEIFDRLPLFYQTLSQYRDDVDFCFAAIGDAYCDSYPLQVSDFGKGVDLEEKLNALYGEGGGGGQVSETYELFGYFMHEHCSTPNAVSPFLFIFGDEKFYEKVNPDQVEHYIGDVLQGPVDSGNIWKGILQKFNTFMLHKPYGYGHDSDVDKEVIGQWKNALGDQRVIELPSAERAVDIAMAIVAKSWGHFGDYTKNIGARHDSDEIDLVMRSIRVLPKDPNAPITRHSMLLGYDGGDMSERLD